MTKNSLAARLLLYVAGLCVLALGIALSVKAGLGVSAVSSLPYVLALATGRDLGGWVTTAYFLFILLQWAIKGKEFRLIDLTQILFSTLFGFLVNMAERLCAPLVPAGYLAQLTLLLASIVLIALGVTAYMMAQLVPMPAEGLADTLADKLNKPFGPTKRALDSMIVITSVILSLVFLGRIAGVREGTVLSALLVGTLTVPFRKKLQPVVDGWIKA